jgi:hypothetical protein
MMPLLEQIPDINDVKYEGSGSKQKKKAQQDSAKKTEEGMNLPINSKGGTNMHVNIPSFLMKTYDIICDPSSDDIIAWNDIGDGFIVKIVNRFQDEVLPKYFKHNNFSSFIR